MTKPTKKPLTAEQGDLLRERAGIVAFTEQTVAQLNGLQQRLTFIDGYLTGAGIPLDTEPPPEPEPEPASPANRAEARRAERAAKKAAEEQARLARAASGGKKAPAKKKAVAKKAPAKKVGPRLASVPDTDAAP